MELRQLRYFLSVADTRSFVSAAGKLFISRQAISKAISQLESELNVELFMRDSNGAFLTPAGIMFYERVRNLVIELDNLSADMKNYGIRFHQHIRLAFSISTMSLFEPKLLDYKNAQVNLDIRYQESPKELCLQQLQEAVNDYRNAIDALKQDWTGAAALIVLGNIVNLTGKIIKSFDRVNDAVKELGVAENLYDENEQKQQGVYNAIDVGMKSPFQG